MADLHVGIDFGTSTTLVATRRGGGLPQTIPIGRSTPWLPSVAAIDEAGLLTFGDDATDQPIHRQFRSVKSKLTAGLATVEIGGTAFEVAEIIQGILHEALRKARAAVKDFDKASRFFLGCPALWTGHERRLLAEVANDLGLDVDIADIIDEPVAAGLFAVNSSLFSGERPLRGRTLVFDAGGGTLDVAYLDAGSGDHADFTVLSAEGVGESGDAVDELIADDLRPQVAGLTPADAALLLLRKRATEMKEALSTDTVRADALGEPFKRVLRYDRPSLDNVVRPQMDRALRLVRSTVRGAELRTNRKELAQQLRQSVLETVTLALSIVTDSAQSFELAYLQPQLDAAKRFLELAIKDAKRLLLPKMAEAQRLVQDAAQPGNAPSVQARLIEVLSHIKSELSRAELQPVSHLSPNEVRSIAWSCLAGTVEHVVLAGGLSQMPITLRELQQLFPDATVQLLDAPQEGVALGLAMGSALDRLSLPRPPVNFIVDYPPHVVQTMGDQWVEKHQYLYRAYTPLYSSHDVARGDWPLGHTALITHAPGCGEIECTITAESPNRLRTPLVFKLPDHDEPASGIRVTLSANQKSHFKLYTTGDLVAVSARGTTRCRIASWPRLRESEREIEIASLTTTTGRSIVGFDDWRFN